MFEKLKKQNYKFWNFCQKIFRNWYLKHEIQKIRAFLFKIYLGNVVMITGGHNLGRVGIIQSRERHPGSFDIVHVKDANGHTFATR